MNLFSAVEQMNVFLARKQDKTLLNLRTEDVPQKVTLPIRGDQVKCTCLVRP